MSKILIIAEHDGATLNPSSAKTLSCAKAIGGDIDIAVFADAPDAPAAQAATLEGVSRVLTINTADNGFRLAATLAPAIVSMASDYSHVLAPSTTFGKDLLPRVAALLGVAQVSDVMAVLSSHEFQRPIYAGNAIVNVSVPADQVMTGTVRTASFPAAAQGGSAAIEPANVSVTAASHTRFVKLEASGGERPDLQSAAKVVSGGRALGSEENFSIIYQLADAMGAGVGASRAAVDAGYVPNDMQVGQTGKIIAPDLYLAIGISGAIQHLTGIKDAGTIVAINKDADAPIFEVADIGLVGDLFNVVPELTGKLG
ncbi:MAG: electron transfer flavoprotein subunit alpha/FixB family protein [Lysobacterales bacterium]